MKAFLAVAMVLTATVMATGCGSSDDDSGGTALTKSEFIKQADQICTDGNTAIEKEAKEFAEEINIATTGPSKADLEAVNVNVVAPGFHRQGEEIAELGAPKGDEEAITAIVEAVERGSDEVAKDPGPFVEGKANPLGEASELARDYGLKVCGGG